MANSPKSLVSRLWNKRNVFKKHSRSANRKDTARPLHTTYGKAPFWKHLDHLQQMRQSTSIGRPMPQMKSMLLSLPGEIRNMIYHELVATCVVEKVESHGDNDYFTSLSGGHVRYTNIDESHPYRLEYRNLSLTLAGLLQACRQTSHELTSFVTSGNRRLDIHPHFHALHSFFTHASADLCSATRKLCLRYVLVLGNPSCDSGDDYDRECLAQRPAEWLDVLASRLPSLEEVECIVHSWGWEPHVPYEADLSHQLAMLLRRFQLTTKLSLTAGPSNDQSGACQVRRVLERTRDYLDLPPERLRLGN